MYLVIVTETWPPQVNGAALTVHALAHGLAERGHGVEVIRPGHDGREAGVRVKVIGTRGARLPHYSGLNFGFPVGLKLRKRWTAQRPDAVYVATEGPLGGSALRVANALRIPVVTGFHTRFDKYAAHYGMGSLKPLMHAHMIRFHRRADATIVPTRALVEELRASGVFHARRLRRSVDTAAFSPVHRDEILRNEWRVRGNAPAVLHVGRLAAKKNIGLAIQAFRALQARVPDARMVLVGDGPIRSQLASENVDLIFAGTLRGQDLARHYASADLFLFPSLTDTFGNVVLEAMASGLALVSFDVAAAREHVVNGISGLLAPVEDKRGFIASAFALALDSGLRNMLATNARIAAQRLTPDATLADFDTLLEHLCRGRPYGQFIAAAHT
jgi:glycosyltransferase involved in cell wall biosynthesis